MKLRSLPFLLIIFSSCVSTSSLFQDGKTSGKKESDAAFSISYNFIPSYALDTTGTTSVSSFKPNSATPAPWLQLQGQYGLTDHLDIGGSFGVGLFSLGIQAFSKFSLLPKEKKLGIAILTSGSFAGSNDKVEDAGVYFYNGLIALPISYQLTQKSAFVLQPIFSSDRYRLSIEDDDQTYKDKVSDQVVKVGFGYIHSNLEKDSKIHYNVALGYSHRTEKILPTFGIAIIP